MRKWLLAVVLCLALPSAARASSPTLLLRLNCTLTNCSSGGVTPVTLSSSNGHGGSLGFNGYTGAAMPIVYVDDSDPNQPADFTWACNSGLYKLVLAGDTPEGFGDTNGKHWSCPNNVSPPNTNQDHTEGIGLQEFYPFWDTDGGSFPGTFEGVDEVGESPNDFNGSEAISARQTPWSSYFNCPTWGWIAQQDFGWSQVFGGTEAGAPSSTQAGNLLSWMQGQCPVDETLFYKHTFAGGQWASGVWGTY